jgi:aminoglycoside phosphotransferase (APT) family kinase protein
MIADQILNLAQQVNPNVKKDHISKLSGGFSSQAYKVDGDDGVFVLLAQRPEAVSRSNYGHAYVVMTLLQRHGIAHTPQPLWLKDDQSALAVSYYDGVASDNFDFMQPGINAERIAIEVIDTLLDAAVISQGEYKELAAQLGVRPLPIEASEDAAAKYGTGWLEIVKESCPDQSIIDWLEPRVQRSVAMAGHIGNKKKPSFGHGDPSNPNILLRNDGSFMLIDWGSARFHTTGPEFYVAYTTHLTDFMKPYRQTLIHHVADRLGVSVEEFSDKVYQFRRYNGVFDVNWAAMMMAKINAGEATGDIEQFHRIALERINAYEKSFER